jgi:hypothetical protein
VRNRALKSVSHHSLRRHRIAFTGVDGGEAIRHIGLIALSIPAER